MKGFKNWPQWADLACTSLEKKSVYNLVDKTRLLFAKNVTVIIIKNLDKKIEIIYNIIKQSIGLKLYVNVIKK